MTMHTCSKHHIRQYLNIHRLCYWGLLALCISANVNAATYYRWVDDEGVPHYSSTPPAGIHSEKVESSSGRRFAPDGSNSSDTANTAATTEEGAAAQSEDFQDPERCEAAKKQLETLENNSRIRMKTEDGGFRYLSPEEIQEKLEEAQQAMADSC